MATRRKGKTDGNENATTKAVRNVKKHNSITSYPAKKACDKVPLNSYSANIMDIAGNPTDDKSDPFDKLLASPMTQSVIFKPLGYWEKKNFEKFGVSPEKKSKGINIYEITASDDSDYGVKKKKKRNFRVKKKRLKNDFEFPTTLFKLAQCKTLVNSAQENTTKHNDVRKIKARQRQKILDKPTWKIESCSKPALNADVMNLLTSTPERVGQKSFYPPCFTSFAISPISEGKSVLKRISDKSYNLKGVIVSKVDKSVCNSSLLGKGNNSTLSNVTSLPPEPDSPFVGFTDEDIHPYVSARKRLPLPSILEETSSPETDQKESCDAHEKVESLDNTTVKNNFETNQSQISNIIDDDCLKNVTIRRRKRTNIGDVSSDEQPCASKKSTELVTFESELPSIKEDVSVEQCTPTHSAESDEISPYFPAHSTILPETRKSFGRKGKSCADFDSDITIIPTDNNSNQLPNKSNLPLPLRITSPPKMPTPSVTSADPFVKPTCLPPRKSVAINKLRGSLKYSLPQENARCSAYNAVVGNETFNTTSILDCDSSYRLKTGKYHNRSRSILRQIKSGQISYLANERTHGRNFLPLVESVVEMQDNETVKTNLKNELMEMSLRSGQVLRSTSARMSTRRSSMVPIARHNMSVRPNASTTLVANDTSRLNTTSNAFEQTFRVVPISDFETTVFRVVHGIDDADSLPDISSSVAALSARDVVLAKCNQTKPEVFNLHFNEKRLKDCKKIGEGVYGEIFLYNNPERGKTVLKVIPIENDLLVNGEHQKTFLEILSEIVITSELSNLRYDEKQRCAGFVELYDVWCTKGIYPKYLKQLWMEYDSHKGSENDNPAIFGRDQLYIVFELAHAGIDLEAFVFDSALQAVSAFKQAVLSLAVSERALEFEHRDFHWGNVLLSNTNEKYITFLLDGRECKVESHGVQVSIIDFTLSRMTYDGCAIFNDLANDEGLFTSYGDYQFDIYRLMRQETENNWESFRPKTNIFWLHYMADKLIKLARYRQKRSKTHSENIVILHEFFQHLLDYESATEFATNNFSF